MWKLIGAQAVLTVASCAWSACITLLLLTSINIVIPIRMSLEDELKGSDACEHGISLSGSFKETRESSAFGTRASSRTQWVDQNPLNQASGSSSSNQSVDPGSTRSDITNESENDGDLIHKSPLGISFEARLSVISTDVSQENGQPNLGFTTNF